jgi:hypothetical protein
MTQTTTSTDPGSDIPLHPSNILMALIITLLAPMFLGVTAGDINNARLAAIETVNAYRARNHADLIAIGQIIGFGLAALGSLSLSMEDDISLSMVLRLRGNANALNRSAEQNRRALAETRRDDAASRQTAAEPETAAAATRDGDLDEAEMFLTATAAQELAAEAEARLLPAHHTPSQTRIPAQTPHNAEVSAEKRHQAMWAIAMVKESGEITAGICNLPPAERRAASIRAAALSSTAHLLLSGTSAPPAISPAPNTN